VTQVTPHNILGLDSLISTAELGRGPSRTPDLEKTPLDVGQLTQEVISRFIVEAYSRRLWGMPNDPHGVTFQVILPGCDGAPP
jgi:hypothetical protein